MIDFKLDIVTEVVNEKDMCSLIQRTNLDKKLEKELSKYQVRYTSIHFYLVKSLSIITKYSNSYNTHLFPLSPSEFLKLLAYNSEQIFRQKIQLTQRIKKEA